MIDRTKLKAALLTVVFAMLLVATVLFAMHVPYGAAIVLSVCGLLMMWSVYSIILAHFTISKLTRKD